MKDFKLAFLEIDQSYSLIDLQKTVKGNVKQITGNIVRLRKYMKDKSSMINLPMRLNFKARL